MSVYSSGTQINIYTGKLIREMGTHGKKSRILLALGAVLTIAGLAFNKWALEALVIEDGHISKLSTLISIGLLQIILIINGILIIIFSTRNPGKGFKYYIRANRKPVEFLLFVTIIFIWVVSISPPNYYTYIFGIYRPWLFATNIALTTIGLLVIYILRDISSWKKRIINSSVFITTIILISFLLELAAATDLIDYREIFIPRESGLVAHTTGCSNLKVTSAAQLMIISQITCLEMQL